jgi:hypothetical protein
LNAFEERVIFVAARRCFLVWMVPQNLLAVGTLDLLLSSFVAVFGES